MDSFSPIVQNFLETYECDFERFQTDVDRACELVDQIARSTGAMLHTVSGRAKTPDSLRSKIRRKGYSDPAKQVTDLIGVRVITFYHDDVAVIVRLLREEFEINERRSIDKRVQLGLREFGYRSVQLVARFKASDAARDSFRSIRESWFEIQVRSILEHAWAEIEHEVVYKSKIDYPEDVTRRFASLAGTIEVLEEEFLALRNQRDDLIDHYRAIYQKKDDDQTPFDVARLLGFFEASRPMGKSWRQAERAGEPFDPRLECACVEALKAVDLDKPGPLEIVLRSRKFRYAASRVAAAHGVAPRQITHPTAVLIALIVTDAQVIKLYFPKIMLDSTIEKMISRRVAK